jgi:hypothetical protein
MKIGMIFECGPKGADWQVCEFLVRKLNPNIDIHQPPTTLTDKKNLIQNCGKSTKILLKQGCDRVIIIWDLDPPWGGKSCRKSDRDKIFKSLNKSNVDINRVYLVCIERELEAWLLADHRPLKELLKKYNHPHPLRGKLRSYKNPDQVQNPKGKLIDIFNQTTGRKYEDHFHAIQIIQNLSDFQKLKNSPTFRRFALKTTDKSFS